MELQDLLCLMYPGRVYSGIFMKITNRHLRICYRDLHSTLKFDGNVSHHVHVLHHKNILLSETIDLKVCDNGILIQLLCFWTLCIILFLFKTQRFVDWILSLSSGGTYLVGPNR
jgi:hypothetical protein